MEGKIYLDKSKADTINVIGSFNKAKLGWLVGNMYSRVGTHDWGDIMDAKKREEMVQSVLKKNFLITGRARLKKTIKELDNGKIKTREEAMKFIEETSVESNYDKAMNIIGNCVMNCAVLDKKQKEALITSIKNKKQLADLIKPE